MSTEASCVKGYIALMLAALWPGVASEADFARAHLGSGLGRRLLDVGCGDGALLAGLVEFGWEGAGLDPDPNAVASARERGLDVRAGTVPARSFPGVRFDSVVACHVIEHVPDPAAFIASLREVTKGGGSLVILTPNVRSRVLAQVGRHWLNLDPPRHLQLIDPEALVALTEAAGFDVVSLTTSIRAVNLNSRAARDLSTAGNFDMVKRPPLAARIRSELSVLGAARALRRDAMSGEELVMVARAS